MFSLIIKFTYKVVALSILATFIMAFFGKYLGMVVYHVNFSLFYFLGGLLSHTTIRSLEVFLIFYMLTLMFKPKF